MAFSGGSKKLTYIKLLELCLAQGQCHTVLAIVIFIVTGEQRNKKRAGNITVVRESLL